MSQTIDLPEAQDKLFNTFCLKPKNIQFTII